MDEAYERAKERVEARRGFFIHLSVYIFVCGALAAINLTTSSAHLWFQWPLLGWGMGVLFHALGVFAFAGRWTITDDMIQRELAKRV